MTENNSGSLNIQVQKPIEISNEELMIYKIRDEFEKRSYSKTEIDTKITSLRDQIENEQLKKIDNLKNWIIATSIASIGIFITFITWFVPYITNLVKK